MTAHGRVSLCLLVVLAVGLAAGLAQAQDSPAATPEQPARAGDDQKAPADDGGAKKDPPAWTAVAGSVWWEDMIGEPRVIFATAEQFEAQDAAEKNAVRMCKAVGGGKDCKAIASLAKDCVYYAVGFTGEDHEEYDWYTADSEQGVADACKTAAADCGEGTHRLCAAEPGYESLSERKFAVSVTGEEYLDDEEVEPGNGEGVSLSWIATAGAVWNDKRGHAHALAAYAEHYAEQKQAEDAALAKCQTSGGDNNCELAGSENTGCLYVTTFHNRKKAGWAQKTTLPRFAEVCGVDGYVCAVPVGGCASSTATEEPSVFVSE